MAKPRGPSGSTRPSPPASRRPARASDPASELSVNDVLQHLAIQRQTNDDFLQPPIPVF